MDFNVNDRVWMTTYMGMRVFDRIPATIVKIYKDGKYKVFADNNPRCYYLFRVDGVQCGTTWKDYTKIKIEAMDAK